MAKITQEELDKWREETMDLMNQLDSLITKMKVELARTKPRKIEQLEILDKMEELL